MEYISTTDLRTKSSQLIKALQKGKTIRLVYRSQVVGNISPQAPLKTEKSEISLLDIHDYLVRIIPPKERDIDWKAIYRKELQKKYGKHLS